MDAENRLAKRIENLCMQMHVSYYMLSYRAAVPITTLMHIMDGSTRNPGIFTIMKICSGFGITITEFFDTEELRGIELEA